MKIQVTQEDIDTGKPGEPDCCAVALAVRRVVGAPARAHCMVADLIEVGNLDYETPPAVIEFINRFDTGQPVEPFEFDLPIVARLGDTSEFGE